MSGFMEGLVRPKVAVTGGVLLAAAALAIVLWLALAGGARPAFATEGECAHADTLIAYSSGVINPANALGPQDGNYVVMGDGGSVTVKFTAQTICDGPGADFRVYEAQVPPVEHALVEVSADGVNFVSLGFTTDYITDFDISSAGIGCVMYVRITDAGEGLSSDTSTPGFDLDAVSALYCAPPPPPPPPPGNEGCTPGFWRNHLSAWAATGYAPGDDFDATFGVDLFSPNITLETAVNLGGGGVKKLARHGTAALLSAAHPNVGYPLTVAQVIALVQAGDADTLAKYNELGCDISS